MFSYKKDIGIIIKSKDKILKGELISASKALASVSELEENLEFNNNCAKCKDYLDFDFRMNKLSDLIYNLERD